MASTVEIVPYRPAWPAEFAEIARPLRQALGDLALRIDHIGSTSVPGLAAKDVIDIQVTVAALDDSLNPPMASLGYLNPGYRRDHATPHFTGPDSEWEKWYFAPLPGSPPHPFGRAIRKVHPKGEGAGALSMRRIHIHVRVLGRANQRYPLLFRDYLRTHPDTAEAYAELKRRLAQYLADPQDYPFVKDPAVDLIYLAAEEWAAAIGWQPGPSDA
jgi:GrpB-like predicted nucleotidyltransferase (UPF0157 family)